MSLAEVTCNFHTKEEINWRYRAWESSKVLRIVIGNSSLLYRDKEWVPIPTRKVYVNYQKGLLSHRGDEVPKQWLRGVTETLPWKCRTMTQTAWTEGNGSVDFTRFSSIWLFYYSLSSPWLRSWSSVPEEEKSSPWALYEPEEQVL